MSVTVAADVGAAAAERLVEALLAARGERVVLGLSGGSSPDGVLAALPGRLPDGLLRRLVLVWVDERVVPYSGAWDTWDPQLNRRAVHERWLQHERVVVAEAPMWEGVGAPAEAADAFAARWARELGALDVWLLGFGPDGHVASLFPGHPALDAPGDVVLVTDAPKPPPVRLTLTLRALRTARRVIGLCTGADKGRALARALRGDEGLPLGRYGAPAVEWVVDRAAADALEQT